MLERLARPSTIHIAQFDWPFIPPDDGDGWKHWLREIMLLGFKIMRRDPDLIPDIVEAISRAFGPRMGERAVWQQGPGQRHIGGQAERSQDVENLGC